MNSNADLSVTKEIHGKDAKGGYVVATLKSLAENSQRGIIEQLKADAVSYHSFWIVNALKVKADSSFIEKIASRADVKKILNNSSFTNEKPVSFSISYNRDITIPWGIDSIYAPLVWAMGYEGQGVVIGGADTGYDWEHPALKNEYRGWNGTTVDHNYNWHDAIHDIDPMNSGANPCGIDISAPCDDYGHGTHTMGTMAGEEGQLKIGIAPKAKWIGERNMERGWGNLASYLEAFQWFIAPTDITNENPDPAKAPHVINNSWYCSLAEGCDINNFSVMEDAVNSVKAAGIVVVVSAGNDGPWCNTIIFPPAIFQNSFTIGAIDSNMNAAWFSSRGNVPVYNIGTIKPNVSAPGVDVLSSIPGGQYAFYSGTSMAGPHTAGLVALMISANPLLAGEVEQIENIIEATAQPVTTGEGCGEDQSSSIPNNTYGYGIIDALAAVQQSLLATPATINSNDTYVSVFPSLTSQFLHVNISNLKQEAVIKFYSVFGSYAGTAKLHSPNNVINLSALPAGVYLYALEVEGRNYQGKIVKR